MCGSDNARFALTFARRGRCVVVPRTGHSEAHARYALALLEALEIEQAHVVGFSMGGGVGLEMAALAPGRVRSLT